MIQYSYKHILRVQVIARFWFTYIAHSQTKTEYACTTGTPGDPLSTVNYAYGNSDWKDLLTEYNGTAINYDLSGNPLNWRNAASLTWDGRRLAGMTLTDGLGDAGLFALGIENILIVIFICKLWMDGTILQINIIVLSLVLRG